MATTRIKDITTAATTFSSDDFVAIDGATSGTRKMAKADLITEVSSGVSGTYLEESNNLSDVDSLDTSKLNMEIPDVGTGPQEVPLNQFLGSCAYQDADALTISSASTDDLDISGNLTFTGTGKIDSAVGIDVTPTASKLEVLGNTNSSLMMTRTSSGIVSNLEDAAGYGSMLLYQAGGSAKVSIQGNGDSYFNGGKVGINQTSPTAQLQVDQTASDQSGAAAIKAVGTAYGTNKAIHAYMNTSSSTKSLLYLENGSGAVVNVQGDGTVALSGGIDLGATVLSEFEQGIFTASVAPATSGTLTVDTASDQLAYAIVGDIVAVHGQIALDGASSPVGDYVKINLPAAIALGTLAEDADYSAGSCVVTSAAGNLGDYSLLAEGGDSFVRIYKNTASTFGATAADFNGDESIYISITYRKA